MILGLTAGTHAEIGKSSGITNPNIAGEKDLLALPHFNAALTKTVLENRPFLDMIALDTLLRKSLNAEQLNDLYAKLFIPLNLNNASEAEILLVPGVGKKMAHEFEEYRPYRAMAQFRKEIGKYVDKEEVARLEQYVFVPVNLNTASDEAIMTIPGMGKRMLHEFKEYRPYKHMAQFRKEIGKYVDEKEVARFERYVTIDE